MKNNKGFTLIEVIVSFMLISIVMICLLKTITVMNIQNTNLILEENYLVYESMVLKDIYDDINSSNNITVTDNNGEITLTSNDFVNQDKIIKIYDNEIVYDDTIYELPDGIKLNNSKYELITNDNYYILKINFKINDNDKIMKIIIVN